MSSSITRADRSFPLVHPEWVEAQLVPHHPTDVFAPCLVELRELSQASAKLLVAGPPALPCRCQLRLVSSKLMRTLEIPAEIGWARPNPAGDWLVECEFNERLSEQMFAEITASGILERRSAVRFQTRISVGVAWEAEAERFPGMVRDLSEGGLCLMTSQPPQDSRNVYIVASHPEGEHTVRLKIRWSLCVGNNHLIGCQFTRGQDFHLLRTLQPNVQQAQLALSEFSPAKRHPH